MILPLKFPLAPAVFSGDEENDENGRVTGSGHRRVRAPDLDMRKKWK